MDLTSILINTVAGAGGGYLGNMVKKNALGMIGNLVAGAVGGNLAPALISLLGMLGDSDAGSSGFSILNIVVSLLGGGAGSLLGGLFKKSA